MTTPSISKKATPDHLRSPRKGDPIGLIATNFFLSHLLIKMTIHSHKHKGSPKRIAKSIALGATLGGMTSPFLKAAMVSTEKVVEMMKLTKNQIEVTIFTAGIHNLNTIARKTFKKIG
jgi:hypothetical protein